MLGLMKELLEKLQRPGLFVHPAWLALLGGVTSMVLVLNFYVLEHSL